MRLLDAHNGHHVKCRVNLGPDHLASVSFRFFRLRLILRNTLSGQQGIQDWTDVVDEFIAQQEEKKIKFRPKSYDWDSGFSE